MKDAVMGREAACLGNTTDYEPDYGGEVLQAATNPTHGGIADSTTCGSTPQTASA